LCLVDGEGAKEAVDVVGDGRRRLERLGQLHHVVAPHRDEDAPGPEDRVLAFVQHRPADHVDVHLPGVVEIAGREGEVRLLADVQRVGVVPPRRPVGHVEARVGDVLGRHHELQLRERAVRVGEDRPVLGCVGIVLEATAEQPEELDVGILQPVPELGEPRDVVDVPGDGVPLPAPALVEAAEGHLLPPVHLEAGLHRLDAEVPDADERGEPLQLRRLVPADPAGDAEHVVVPGVERRHVVGHVDEVEVRPDGEHARSLPPGIGLRPITAGRGQASS